MRSFSTRFWGRQVDGLQFDGIVIEYGYEKGEEGQK